MLDVGRRNASAAFISTDSIAVTAVNITVSFLICYSFLMLTYALELKLDRHILR